MLRSLDAVVLFYRGILTKQPEITTKGYNDLLWLCGRTFGGVSCIEILFIFLAVRKSQIIRFPYYYGRIIYNWRQLKTIRYKWLYGKSSETLFPPTGDPIVCVANGVSWCHGDCWSYSHLHQHDLNQPYCSSFRVDNIKSSTSFVIKVPPVADLFSWSRKFLEEPVSVDNSFKLFYENFMHISQIEC